LPINKISLKLKIVQIRVKIPCQLCDFKWLFGANSKIYQRSRGLLEVPGNMGSATGGARVAMGTRGGFRNGNSS